MTDILCDIFCRCYPQFRMSEERFRQFIANDSVHILTHSENGEIAGFAVIESFALRLICVEPGYQRRGIGSALLEEAEKYIAGKGFDKLITGGVSSKFLIGADKSAKGFFEKKGFRCTGSCDELMLRLDGYTFDESSFRGHKCAEYGWYSGSMDKLHKAVAEVKEDWVQFFTEKQHIYTAKVGGEIASFCIVDTDAENYLTDSFGRVGMPGCVGTVPKFRDRGIAIEMVARATQYLKDCGMDISFIYFTGIADWYKKLGYEVFMTEMFMEKQLRA